MPWILDRFRQLVLVVNKQQSSLDIFDRFYNSVCSYRRLLVLLGFWPLSLDFRSQTLSSREKDIVNDMGQILVFSNLRFDVDFTLKILWWPWPGNGAKLLRMIVVGWADDPTILIFSLKSSILSVVYCCFHFDYVSNVRFVSVDRSYKRLRFFSGILHNLNSSSLEQLRCLPNFWMHAWPSLMYLSIELFGNTILQRTPDHICLHRRIWKEVASLSSLSVLVRANATTFSSWPPPVLAGQCGPEPRTLPPGLVAALTCYLDGLKWLAIVAPRSSAWNTSIKLTTSLLSVFPQRSQPLSTGQVQWMLPATWLCFHFCDLFIQVYTATLILTAEG